jgi:hypothetical protein
MRKGANPVRLSCNMLGSEPKAAVEEVRDLEDGGGRESRGGDSTGGASRQVSQRWRRPPGLFGMLEAGRFTRTNLQERPVVEVQSGVQCGRIAGCAWHGKEGWEERQVCF